MYFHVIYNDNDIIHDIVVNLMTVYAGFHGKPPAGASPEADHDQAASNSEQ